MTFAVAATMMLRRGCCMRVPEHLGIIMDGNGRWAASRGLSRSKGHAEGLKITRRITKAASELGVRYLSLYVFSTENWKRSTEEVGFLMGLVAGHLEKELGFYDSLGLRVVHSGDPAALPKEVRRAMTKVVAATAKHQGMVVNLALNHGGRDEILRAVDRWSHAHPRGAFSEAALRSHLDVPELPDLDLLIRTGGELRLSNFLLWQAAYAELVFSEKLWPDFHEADLKAAFAEYTARDRRFGGISGEENLSKGRKVFLPDPHLSKAPKEPAPRRSALAMALAPGKTTRAAKA
jgi:undecaprenyl diphosphate synthase